MWILARDALSVRNGLNVKLKESISKIEGLEAEIEDLKFKLNNQQT